MVDGWNGCVWLPVGGRETLPTSWSKKAVRLIGVPEDGWFHIGMADSANSDTLKAFLDKAIKVNNINTVWQNATLMTGRDACINSVGIERMVPKPRTISMLRLPMEVDVMCATLGDLIEMIEASDKRLSPLAELDISNQELLQEVIPALSQERASELMMGMLVLLDLVPPEGVPHSAEQISDMKAKLHTLEAVSTHLHNALDGVAEQ